MIRHIVAMDQARGMAKNGAMPPWKLHGDEAYFTQQTLTHGAVVLMGRKTFTEALHERPLQGRTNIVVTRNPAPIAGTTVVTDLEKFMREWPKDEDLWIIGGSEIFTQTLADTDELYITHVDGNFECDRFYPEFGPEFVLHSESEVQNENGVTYRYAVYTRQS